MFFWNLLFKKLVQGNVASYAYSALDLVTNTNYNGAKEVTYAYNKVGELVKLNIEGWLYIFNQPSVLSQAEYTHDLCRT